MTLATHFIINSTEPDPKNIFDFVNEALLKAGGAAQWEHQLAGSSFDRYPINNRYANEPGQGLNAMMDVEYGDPLRTYEDIYPEDYEDGDDQPRTPEGRIGIRFDTAYGYSDDAGRGCGDLHADYIKVLGQYCESKGWEYHWQNEFTGEWFADWREATQLGTGRREALEWLTETVIPALFSESEWK